MPSILRSITLKQKLISISFSICTVVLALSCIGLIYSEFISIKYQKLQALNILTETIAKNLTAAVAFKDIDATKEILSGLDQNPDIVSAKIVLIDGEVFSKYLSGNPNIRGNKFTPNELIEGSSPVRMQNIQIANLIITAHTRELYIRIQELTIISAFIIILGLIVAVLLANKLQSEITAPVIQLINNMIKIFNNRDYSVRADTKINIKEFSVLCEQFNQMVIEIEKRDNELIHAHEVLEDKVKERTEQLLRAREEALKVAEMRAQLIANVSHELRTPLNGIIGFAEIALDYKNLTEDQLEEIGAIKSSGILLKNIVDDILDFSKLESPKITLESIPCDINELLQEIGLLSSSLILDKNIEFITEVQSELPRVILTDPTRLKQVIINLVGNAIKFTEKGQVKVSLNKIVHNKLDMLHFTIKDSGIGINKSKFSSIFGAFVQADGGTTRKFGGTGLGLAIVTRIVNLVGGEVSVDSIEGKGSTFTFTWPLIEPNSQSKSNWDALSVSGSIDKTDLMSKFPNFPVLVAEDNPVNQKLIEILLRKLGCNVTIAHDGIDVIEHFEAGEFGLILMDLQMPRLSGLEASGRIRISGPKGAEIPIVALTAHAFTEDHERAIAVGMNGYLTKPIDKVKLVETITKYYSSYKGQSVEK